MWHFMHNNTPRIAEHGVAPGMVGGSEILGWRYPCNKQLVIGCPVYYLGQKP